MKILHRFLRSSAVAIKIVFGFNWILIVGGSYFCHDDFSQAIGRGRSLGCQVSFALCVAGLAAWLIALYWKRRLTSRTCY